MDWSLAYSFIAPKDNAVQYWKTKGAPPKKIILGIPAYGRTFTLSTSQNGVKAPTSGPGTAGVYTKERGFLAYYEVRKRYIVMFPSLLQTRKNFKKSNTCSCLIPFGRYCRDVLIYLNVQECMVHLQYIDWYRWKDLKYQYIQCVQNRSLEWSILGG